MDEAVVDVERGQGQRPGDGDADVAEHPEHVPRQGLCRRNMHTRAWQRNPPPKKGRGRGHLSPI